MPLSALGKRWTELEPSPEAHAIAETLGLHPHFAGLLWHRGHRSRDQIEAFLEPRLQSLGDPFDLTDLRAAAERLREAVQRKERIAIFGDYDVDGIASTALLARVLVALGAAPATFLPLRMEEGYGLSQEGIERCVEEHRPQLLVAVDCGTTALEQVAWLRARGIDVVIIDHHALPPELPAANALVNPQRDGHHDYFASVGLVFKVCHGLLKLLAEKGAKPPVDLREYLDLVALGTVADIVPLVEENRVLVHRGLRQLEHSRWAGVRALVEVAQISFPVTAQDVGFRLGPRLNASGRLGDAMRSLRLLQTDDPAEARALAAELNRTNAERQAVERRTFEEAEQQLEAVFDPAKDWGIVLAGQGWHWGVIGIVASRLQKKYHRPVIVIGLDETGVGKGSGRSIDGISLITALRACAEHLELFGGHDMAAGVTIRAERVDSFRDAFNRHVLAIAARELFQPSLDLAGIFRPGEVGRPLFQHLGRLSPFGRHHPEPVFIFEPIDYLRPPRAFGRDHIKLFLPGEGHAELEAVGFGLARHDWSRPPSRLAAALDWDDYRDRVNLRIIDWMA